nr:MAG TPA: hypothetical protein [Caudoviricetes sp.]
MLLKGFESLPLRQNGKRRKMNSCASFLFIGHGNMGNTEQNGGNENEC